MSEREWVQWLQNRLQPALEKCGDKDWRVEVCFGEKLAYAHEIMTYHENGGNVSRAAKYETDVLIYDINSANDWIPRVVLECKVGSVTTHDALTYSTKAATHKHVHPYLRYGILIGAFDTALPGRLIRHGAYFDFMMVWQAEEPSEKEWSGLTDLLADEIEASRTLQTLLTDRTRSRKRFRLLHRPLRLL